MDWKSLISDLCARGWTQALLADVAGCKQPTISDLANGATKSPKYEIGDALVKLHESGATPSPSATEVGNG